MALTQQTARRPRRGANPLTGPVLLLAAAALAAVGYVAYVLWPRWPDAPVSLDAPSLPIIVSGVSFNIEPAAIRMPVQRKAGRQDRVDLSYLWPSLQPPDPAQKLGPHSTIDPNERLFVTIASGETTLPVMERVQTIYPRYLDAGSTAGPEGLTVRRFRDGTPYQGEELVSQAEQPEHFLARCSLQGVSGSGSCLLERRIGEADITVRFPRSWLTGWRDVAAGIDKLVVRLHPN
jgi:hypothetical protein